MLSFGSRDDEPVGYLTLAARSQYTNLTKQTLTDEYAFIEAVIAFTEFIFYDQSV